MIADALVIQSQGDGAHWTQSARSFLRGLILYVAMTKEPDSRTLITVRHLLTQGRKEFDLMLADMIGKGGDHRPHRLGAEGQAADGTGVGDFDMRCAYGFP